MHADVEFADLTVTVSAERVDGSTPGARVTWSTTVPPECVASVRVEFRTSMITGSPVVRSYTTTNTSQTEVIQTGLQCATTYYIRVVVTGVPSLGALNTVASNPVQVPVGGIKSLHTKLSVNELICGNKLCYPTDIPISVRVRAEVTADNTSIRVLWEWSHEGELLCLDSVRVDYQPEGGSLMMYTVASATATSATLSNLLCNTQYTISVYAEGDRTGGRSIGKRSVTRMVSLPARGICYAYILGK